MDPLNEIVENIDENLHVQSFETKQGFAGNILVNQELLKRIKSTKLNLRKENIFNIPLLDKLKRKNNIYYFVRTKELAVDINDTSGEVYLPLITREEINRNLLKVDSKTRSTISTIHLGAIKILIKAAFPEGIDSPIKMALIDNRINDRHDCILGAARGNLAYQKFMFTVYPKYGFSLNTKNLDKVLTFVHEFERNNLMNSGDKVFSLTYLVAYALTNSHHSIDYKKKEYIELEDVFSEIGTVQRKTFSELNPPNVNWAINIAKDKPRMGEPYKSRVIRDRLEIGEPSRRSFSAEPSRRSLSTEPSERELLKGISKRINDMGIQLEQISGSDE